MSAPPEAWQVVTFVLRVLAQAAPEAVGSIKEGNTAGWLPLVEKRAAQPGMGEDAGLGCTQAPELQDVACRMVVRTAGRRRPETRADTHACCRKVRNTESVTPLMHAGEGICSAVIKTPAQDPGHAALPGIDRLPFFGTWGKRLRCPPWRMSEPSASPGLSDASLAPGPC